MSKKVQKTLTGAMAAMMATGVVATPAMAATNNTDVDALYKAAYQATQKALTEKTQASVNEARKAIKALPANLDWAIGEFSKQVDSVQHPILVNIVNAIKTAEANPTQANINEARKAIPADLVAQYKNSYSAAVDKIQQGLQAKVVEAVKLAETSRKAEDVEAAKALIADIATADSQSLKDWAKVMLAKVEAVKLYDLDITKVVTITKTGLTVEFKALKDALKDATIEVVDNNGNIVKVEKISSLIEEETTATFYFTSILKDTPSGVWTVNGVKVDLTERANITKIKEIGNAKDLLAKLKELKFKGLVDVNAEAYFDADKSKVNSYEDLQNLIDNVNKDEAKKAEVAYVIESAAGTTTQFKNALATLELDKVNSDWISEYKTALKGKEYTKVSEVQEVIYTANASKLKTEKDNALDITETDKKEVALNEVIALAKEYHKDDVKDVTVKATFINGLNLNLAEVRVQNANSLATLKSALVNLEKAVNDKTKFEYAKDVNESMLKAYYDGYGKKPSVKTAKTTSEIKTALADIQDVIIGEKVAGVKTVLVEPAKDGKYSAEEKTAITNALKALATATSNKADADKFVMDKVVEANYGYYYEVVKAGTIVDGIVNLNKVIKDGNDKPLASAIDNIKKADNAKDLLAALKNSTLALSNVKDANMDAYVAETGFKTIADKTAAQNLVNAVNAAQVVLTSNNIDEVSSAVLSFAVATDNSDVKNLSSLVRKDVAEEVKKVLKEEKAEALTTEGLTLKLTTAKSSQSTNVGDVNTAYSTGNVAMVTALEKVSAEFAKLTGEQKIAVAEKFIAKFPKDSKNEQVPFKNYTEIRTLLAECMK